MAQATLGRWGNNLAVRLPGEVVRAARLKDGERVEIEAWEGSIIIRLVEPQVRLEDMFDGRSPEAWRGEYAGVYDWGPDVGQEIVAD